MSSVGAVSRQEPLWGKYRGFVRDAKDPKKLNRVRAQVPDVLGDVITDWAWPVLPIPANLDVGLFFRPKEGDQVWIEFEAGDKNRPLWTGGWWTQDQIPGLASADGENDPSRAGRGTDFVELPTPLNEIINKDRVNEPEDEYSTRYGDSVVLKLPGGFVLEAVGREGFQSLTVFHPEGTFAKIADNGRVVFKAAGGRYARINGDDVDHVVGSKVEQVEKDKYTFVEGDEAKHVLGKLHLRVDDGFILEDALGNMISFDKEKGRLVLQAFGNMDITANGTITIQGLNVNVQGRSVLPTKGVAI